MVWSPRIPENERNPGPQTTGTQRANILNLKIVPPTRKRRVPSTQTTNFLGSKFKMLVDSGVYHFPNCWPQKLPWRFCFRRICCWTEAIISKTQPLRPRVCTEIPVKRIGWFSSFSSRFLLQGVPNPLKIGDNLFKEGTEKDPQRWKSSLFLRGGWGSESEGQFLFWWKIFLCKYPP